VPQGRLAHQVPRALTDPTVSRERPAQKAQPDQKAHKDLKAPPAHKDLKAPPAHKDLKAPPAHKDLQAPPAHKDLPAPPAQQAQPDLQDRMVCPVALVNPVPLANPAHLVKLVPLDLPANRALQEFPAFQGFQVLSGYPEPRDFNNYTDKRCCSYYAAAPSMIAGAVF